MSKKNKPRVVFYGYFNRNRFNMVTKPLKSGREINITSGDISLKGVIGRLSKKDDLQKIEIPTEWKDTANGIEIGSECLLTSEKDGEDFTQYKMILMEKKLDETKPILLLKPFQEVKKHNELRQQERVKAFIFTVVSGKEGEVSNATEEKAIAGTLSDVSTGGCLLMSNHFFNVSDTIWLESDLMEGESVIRMKSIVRNRRQTHIEKSYFYGIEFLNLGPHEKGVIEAYLDNPSG